MNSGALFLLATSLIWGLAFVAQSVAMDSMGPFTFCFFRFFLSGTALIPVILIRHLTGADGERVIRGARRNLRRKTALFGGMICGIFLFGGSGLQQFGLQYTTPGKAGFLTALYIILVPIYGIALGRKAGKKVFGAALLALIGLYLLCIEDRLALSRGDRYVILCALVFPFQILSVDHFARETDPVQLACVQFYMVALISGVLAFLTESPSAAAVQKTLIPLLYAGLMSGSVAYTFQIIGQQKMNNPSAASLIMSLESVFAAIGGWLILHDAMSLRKLLGCAVMFAAILIAQL